MKKFPKLWISLAIIVAVLAWKGPQWLAFGKGVHAYLYGYPLVIADMTERLMTAPSAIAAQKPGAAPVNRLAHLQGLSRQGFHCCGDPQRRYLVQHCLARPFR